MNPSYRLDTRDRPELLFAMMRTLTAENARIAFEGNLGGTELFGMHGASHEETGTLKRATIAPRLDYVILPLVPNRVPEIEKAIRSKISFNGYGGIIHVQIELDGQTAFAAYDNFARGSVIVSSAVPVSILEELVNSRILKGYSPVTES